jgi:hypothetical protein
MAYERMNVTTDSLIYAQTILRPAECSPTVPLDGMFSLSLIIIVSRHGQASLYHE